MRKLIAMILMFGLVIGPAVIVRASDFDIHFGKDHSYGSYSDRFTQWDARQRDRIQDAFEFGLINDSEHDRLTQELSNVATFHNQAFSNGWASDEDQARLERMEERLRASIDREVSEHMGDCRRPE